MQELYLAANRIFFSSGLDGLARPPSCPVGWRAGMGECSSGAAVSHWRGAVMDELLCCSAAACCPPSCFVDVVLAAAAAAVVHCRSARVCIGLSAP